METSLLEKIQTARQNPIKAVQDLQLNPGLFGVCYPELRADFNAGLPELLPDDRLFSAAQLHAEDMVKQQYFSKISKDGQTLVNRMEGFSYYPLVSGEAHGVLLFRNYLPKEAAVNALFKNIVSNELKCSEGSQPVVFNPEFSEIGLSVKSGTMEIQGMKLNFYLAVVDVGKENIELSDQKLLRDINLFRNQTVKNDIVLQPWDFNKTLYELSQLYTDEVLTDLSQRGNNLERALFFETETIEPINDDMITAHTTKIWITSDEKTEKEAVDYLFDQVFDYELGISETEQILFNPTYTDAGVMIKIQPMQFGDDANYYVHVMTIVAGKQVSPIDESVTLSGVVYTDVNGNQTLDSGEEHTGAYVDIENGITKRTVITNRFGQFTTDLMPGLYWIRDGNSNDQIELIEREIELVDQNLLIIVDSKNPQALEND